MVLSNLQNPILPSARFTLQFHSQKLQCLNIRSTSSDFKSRKLGWSAFTGFASWLGSLTRFVTRSDSCVDNSPCLLHSSSSVVSNEMPAGIAAHNMNLGGRRLIMTCRYQKRRLLTSGSLQIETASGRIWAILLNMRASSPAHVRAHRCGYPFRMVYLVKHSGQTQSFALVRSSLNPLCTRTIFKHQQSGLPIAHSKLVPQISQRSSRVKALTLKVTRGVYLQHYEIP